MRSDGAGARALEIILASDGTRLPTSWDAVTVYVHPALVATAANSGISMEPAIHRMMGALTVAFRVGLTLSEQ